MYSHLRAVLHVHSNYSTGTNTLEEIVVHAKSKGINVVIFTDYAQLRLDCKIPFRSCLVKVNILERNSIFKIGIKTYLEEIDRLQLKYHDMILIPGTEIVPYYSWTLDVTNRKITLSHIRKHILVIGLENECDYNAIPIYGSSIVNSYGVGSDAYQNIISYTKKKNAIVCWAHPDQPGTVSISNIIDLMPAFFKSIIKETKTEDKTLIELSIAGVEIVSMVIHATSYVEEILASNMYVGFSSQKWKDALPTSLRNTESLNATIIGVNNEWDQLLMEYCCERRKYPIWIVGDVDYHRGNKIDQVITGVWVKDRSRTGVLEALRNGRLYAEKGEKRKLSLKQFNIMGKSKSEVAHSGEILRDYGPFSITIGIESETHEEMDIFVIRLGKIVRKISGIAPRVIDIVDSEYIRSDMYYYRIVILSAHSEIVTNPIFVQPPAL